MTITPILLCGGAGTRLWPMSRRGHPKPFVPLSGGETPFAATLARLRGPGFAPPLAVAGPDLRFLAADGLEAAGIALGALPPAPGGERGGEGGALDGSDDGATREPETGPGTGTGPPRG